MLKKSWNSIFVETFYKTEQEKESSLKFDKKLLVLFLTTAFSLIFIQYIGDLNFIKSLNNSFLNNSINSIRAIFPNERLFELVYWVSIIIVCYFIIPIIIIKNVFKENLSNFGLSTKGIFKSYQIYILFFVLMIPLVLLVSTTVSFQHKYPFYQPLNESIFPNFIIWQCFYFLQFFALEFFFRGFMVHGLKKQFGYYSIFIMMIPYVMIHFQKPMPETIGAIIAGIVLGSLSLKSRSIWLGVAIHYSVAITMDIAALWQKGYFG
jgi:membrane protease YdiL (CAAX protease family)